MEEKKFRLPKDIPLEEYPKPDVYLEEGRHLVDEADKQGILLRVMGPVALHYYFPDYVDLYRRMERLGERVFTDIDFAAYGKHRNKLVPFFESQGYTLEKRAAMQSGGARLIFFAGRVPMIDIFFDKLNYNHPINYIGRLAAHPYCVSLADLMLQKLQIVQINDKDLKDAMLLLLAAPVGDSDDGKINATYLGKIFSEDWGFYYTATTNLRKIKEAMGSIPALSDLERAAIAEKVDALLKYIEDLPKSGKWKSRAKVGISRPWYQEITDWD